MNPIVFFILNNLVGNEDENGEEDFQDEDFLEEDEGNEGGFEEEIEEEEDVKPAKKRKIDNL
jgi:hypothetical protein